MLKTKLLHPDAKVPARANPTDAGLDLCALSGGAIPGFDGEKINTGISISIPDGHVARILPRSGLAVKHGIHVMAGVVDSSYRGELIVVLQNLSDRPFFYNAGDRIAQLVIQKVELWNPQIVDELDDTDRGNGGFGSTGL